MRPTLALALALLLGLGVWMVVRADDAAPVLPPSPELEHVDATPVDATASVVATPTVERTAADAAASGAANEAPPIPDDATWFELTVVDGETKQPVAGADVWWTTDAQRAMLAELPPVERDELSRDRDAVARRFGWYARTDGKGTVRVATPKGGGAQVIAQDEHRYAQGWFQAQIPPSPEDQTLELQPDRTLLVHVTDAAGGDAAGVPVELTPHDPDSDRGPMFVGHGQVRTDVHGIARFAHVQRMAKWTWGPQHGKKVEQFALGVTTPGIDVDPTLVDATQLPGQPVELRLPPSGHVRVRLTFQQRPLAQLNYIELDVPRLPVWQQQVKDVVPTITMTRPVEADGFATFSHLPLGMRFTVVGHGAGACPQCTIDGPSRAGTTVSTTIDLSDRAAAIEGSLCDTDGAPLAEVSVPIDYFFGVAGGVGELRTGPDGRFFWLAGGVLANQRPGIERLVLQWQSKDETPLRCAVAPRPLALGRNDLGDLRLGIDALVVGGRLVFQGDDGDGTRRRVSLQVECLEPSTEPPPRAYWRAVLDLQQALQEDGTFEVRGAVGPGRHRLRVHGDHQLPIEPIEFVPGTKDLVVTFPRSATIEATCLLPEGIEAHQLRLRLVRQPGTPTTQNEDRPGSGGPDDRMCGRPVADRDERHQYRWPAIEPGTYSLRVEKAPGMPPVLTVPDVCVPPPAGGDPRLARLDLRDVMQALNVRLRFASDERPTRAVLFPLPQPDADDWVGFSLHGQESTVPMPKGPLDLLVATEGYRPVTLRSVQGEVDVRMERWPSVELRFAIASELPEGTSLAARVRRSRGEQDRRGFRTDEGTGRLADLLELHVDYETAVNGAVTIAVGDGVQPLEVVLWGKRSGVAPRFVEPREVFAGSPVDVQLSLEELRRIAEQLRKQDR